MTITKDELIGLADAQQKARRAWMDFPEFKDAIIPPEERVAIDIEARKLREIAALAAVAYDMALDEYVKANPE